MIEFKSVTGNTYAWDEEVGLFIPFPPTMKAVVMEIANKKSKEEIIERLKRNFNEEDITYCYDWLLKWNRIKFQTNNVIKETSYKNITESSFKVHILKYGLKQLTLSVTNECNLRCKYCGYSEYYEYTKGYSNKHMSFIVAKKAIDYYFSLIEEGRKYNPKRVPSVAFYGGEPLMSFGLIKKCIEYINNTYTSQEVNYNITTNGCLLDKDKVDWLIKNKVSVTISLDGPQDEHDRNRVYRNGKGSFEDITRNVSRFLDTKYEKFLAISVFDLKADLFKRDEFFGRSDVPQLGITNAVNSGPGCTYYNQFTEKDRLAFIEQITRARSHYIEKLKDQKGQKRKRSVFDLLFGESSSRALDRCISIYSSIYSLMSFTASCIPGEKIFVDVDGYFHICERVNGTYHIGNVEDGLDFGRIKDLVSEYLSHMDKCDSCKLKRSCNKCFSHFMAGKEFLYSSEVCEEDEIDQVDAFSTAFSIGEIDPEFR